MKFANLLLDTNKKMENIGDWVQIFAIENLYNYMGISKDEIVSVRISELSSYDGESVILPINFPFYGYYSLSPKIIPVYLGISVMSGSVVKGLRMQNFQPIGCRDYHTLMELRKMGLETYYGGCLTIAFPKRTASFANKIFIVDVSENILSLIPQDIKDQAEFITHIYYDDECGGEVKAREIYARYAKEAKLVITSRIHCAQPCLAMGIPVIFICEIKSFRYEVLKPFIPIYTISNMNQIDWNPSPPDIEYHKKRLLDCAADQINNTLKKYEKICEISEFYLASATTDYEIDSIWAFQRYIKETWKSDDIFQYAIWGITQCAEVLYSWIRENYPRAVLAKVIDNNACTAFHGVFPERENCLEDFTAPVFVTAGSANPVAEKVFKKYHVQKYVICYNNLYVVDGTCKSY